VWNSIEGGTSESVVSNVIPRLCLITDDSAPVRRIARKILTGLGFEVDEAEHGQVALDKCQVRMPNMILLDWNMPVMDGLEFLVALRHSEGGKVPTVIFCTTETDVEHIQKAIECGADDYLMKPFDRETLTATLAGVTPRA